MLDALLPLPLLAPLLPSTPLQTSFFFSSFSSSFLPYLFSSFLLFISHSLLLWLPSLKNYHSLLLLPPLFFFFLAHSLSLFPLSLFLARPSSLFLFSIFGSFFLTFSTPLLAPPPKIKIKKNPQVGFPFPKTCGSSHSKKKK